MKRFGGVMLAALVGCTVNGKAFGPSFSSSSSTGSSSSSSQTSSNEQDPAREAEKRAAAEREAERQRGFDADDRKREEYFAKQEAKQAAARKQEQDDAAARAEHKTFCATLEPVEDASARENADRAAWALVSDCPHSLRTGLWHLDEKAETSQVWHLAAVFSCYRKIGANTELRDIAAEELKDSSEMMNFAFCAYDGAQLNRAKFEAELKANRNLTPRIRGWMLESFGVAKAFMEKHTAAYKQLAKQQPVVEDIVFTAPQAAFKDWTSAYNANKAVYDVIIDVERRGDLSKKALKGCAAKLRPAYLKLMAERKPQDLERYRDAIRDAYASRLIVALAFCEMVDGDEMTAALLLDGVGAARGPRQAAAMAALAKIVEARQDNPKFSTQPGVLEHKAEGPAHYLKPTHYVHPTERGGIVAKVERKDGRAVITFKSTSWMEQTYNCKPTKQIQRIDSLGNVVYRENCRPAGKEKVTWNERAVTVNPAYTTGIKPGQFLVVRRKWNEREFYDKDEPLWGALPMYGYTNTNKTKLVSVLGQPL